MVNKTDLIKEILNYNNYDDIGMVELDIIYQKLISTKDKKPTRNTITFEDYDTVLISMSDDEKNKFNMSEFYSDTLDKFAWTGIISLQRNIHSITDKPINIKFLFIAINYFVDRGYQIKKMDIISNNRIEMEVVTDE